MIENKIFDLVENKKHVCDISKEEKYAILSENNKINSV